MPIAFESPDKPEVVALIAELDAYQGALYPPESVHALDLSSVRTERLLFAVARDDTDQAIGCGAIVLHAQHGELKRMFVRPRHRGRGIAGKLLGMLEFAAQQAGCPLLKLETGPRQQAALALYARHGYERCAPYAPYSDDPLSVFMQKRIAPSA